MSISDGKKPWFPVSFFFHSPIYKLKIYGPQGCRNTFQTMDSLQVRLHLYDARTGCFQMFIGHQVLRCLGRVYQTLFDLLFDGG